MERKENYLCAVRFERPDYIPIVFCINDACWQAYPQEFLGQHRTIVSAAFAQSFAPSVQL